MSLLATVQQKRSQLHQFMARNDRDWWYLGPLMALFGIGVVVDIWLVTHGHYSITKDVTDLANAHTAILAFGWMVCFGLFELVQRYRWMTMTVWVLAGHLFTGLSVCP